MIAEGYTYTIPNPYTPRSPQANRVVNTILPTEIDNVLRGVKTAEQAAADMCTQLDEILKSADKWAPMPAMGELACECQVQPF
jgi:hypothetical protein